MSMTLQEIKESICGEGIDGKSRAISIAGAHKYNMIDPSEEPKLIAEISSMEPIVSVIIGPEITWVSLKFIYGESNDLKLFFRTYERYLEETDNNTDSAEAVAFLTLLPIELAGQYYISAVHPIMWALEPEAVGEDFRTLRIAFFSENVSFLQSNLGDDFFDKALVAAGSTKDSSDEFVNIEYDEYGHSERDEEFISEDKYIPDLNGEDFNKDDFDDEDKPTDRSSYVYH